MKTMALVLGAVALVSLAGCSAPASTDGNDNVAADEGALRSSSATSATKKAIKGAVELWNGGVAKRTHEIKIGQAPTEVRDALQAAHDKIVSDLSDFGEEKDLSMGVYEVFKSPKSKTVVGYAVWGTGDNGDAGQAYVLGFDLTGKQIVDEDDSWSED